MIDIKDIISKMTLKEKIGQLSMRGDTFVIDKNSIKNSDADISMISAYPDLDDIDKINCIQKEAVEKSRFNIPIIFCLDIVHGYRTIFPIPLSEAMSFDLNLAEETAAAAAEEAAACGVKWTFAPMVDVARNPHWGRMCEGSGEDTFVCSEFGKARVKGFQGNDPSAENKIAACPKHFAGYGFVEGGKEYNTVDMSESKLFNVVLPPFKAAIDSGALTVMASFTDVNREPCTASKWILTDLLRDKLNFNGAVISDCNALEQLLNHRVAKDGADAASKAINAGIDMEMASKCFQLYLENKVKSGEISEKVLDTAVERILNLKNKLGIFEKPYADKALAKKVVFSEKNRKLAQKSACRSVALIKHCNLPLKKETKIALIGPFADNHAEMLGEWCANGIAEDCITLYDALKNETEVIYAKGCDFNSTDTSGFFEAVDAANKSDATIVMLGQTRDMCGEARSRANLDIDAVQLELLKEIRKTGKPIVLIIVSGRPIVIEKAYEMSDDVLYSGALGSMAGNAYCDILFGRYNPSAKLVFTLPRSSGSAGYNYYNHPSTGRPGSDTNAWSSRWIDEKNTPFLPFGYGLSYTTFEYSNIILNNKTINSSEFLDFSVDVTNTGKTDGEETVQIYITNKYPAEARPVKELKAFKKHMIKSGETKRFTFKIPAADFGYYKRDKSFSIDRGEYILLCGKNSEDCITESFFIN